MGQQNNMVSGAWHSSAADYKESVRDNDIKWSEYEPPYEPPTNEEMDKLFHLDKNYMKKWSKEDEEKLMKILDSCVEQDKEIKYDTLLRIQFQRTYGAIIARFKQLIYNEYDESSWEDCIKAAGISKWQWELFVNKKKQSRIGKQEVLYNKIKDLIEKYNSQYDKNLKLTF